MVRSHYRLRIHLANYGVKMILIEAFAACELVAHHAKNIAFRAKKIFLRTRFETKSDTKAPRIRQPNPRTTQTHHRSPSTVPTTRLSRASQASVQHTSIALSSCARSRNIGVTRGPRPPAKSVLLIVAEHSRETVVKTPRADPAFAERKRTR